ncbi:MAG TPA: arginine deiminase-related protein [Candidatus Dormibacteraeota bacterium]|nr:arginine deiminase-related protein [Candidatus Dormibacteraeota bacterium]
MDSRINRSVLMSGADYFDVIDLNAYSHNAGSIDRNKAAEELIAIKKALEQAGIEITQVAPPPDCQDGIFTANWGLCRGDTVVLSYLPSARRKEQPYAEKLLGEMGFRTVKAPYRFSGQGDALPCGDYLFMGSNYRTDPLMHDFLAAELGYQVIALETIPEVDTQGQPIINSLSGWADSYFYDLDLALAVITPGLIAWCPEAFSTASQQKIVALPLDKLSVSFEEAKNAFACNLVSTGETVVMSANAPKLKSALESRGFKTITPFVTEIGKGGGYIRCCALTLDNN